MLTLSLAFNHNILASETALEKAILESQPETVRDILQKKPLTESQRSIYTAIAIKIMELKQREIPYSTHTFGPQKGDGYMAISLVAGMFTTMGAFFAYAAKPQGQDFYAAWGAVALLALISGASFKNFAAIQAEEEAIKKKTRTPQQAYKDALIVMGLLSSQTLNGIIN